MPTTTKALKDGAGGSFNGYFWDDGTGTLVPISHIDTTVESAVGTPGSQALTMQGSPLGTQVPVAEPPIIVSSGFTRPANTTAYAAQSLVANSTAAGSVTPLSFALARGNNIPGAIIGAKIGVVSSTITSWLNATVRIRFYGSSPVPANGDGGAWLTPQANYYGYIDVVLQDQFSDGVAGVASPLTVPEIDFLPATGTNIVYALLEVMSTSVTPAASDVFTVTLFGK